MEMTIQPSANPPQSSDAAPAVESADKSAGSSPQEANGTERADDKVKAAE